MVARGTPLARKAPPKAMQWVATRSDAITETLGSVGERRQQAASSSTGGRRRFLPIHGVGKSVLGTGILDRTDNTQISSAPPQGVKGSSAEMRMIRTALACSRARRHLVVRVNGIRKPVFDPLRHLSMSPVDLLDKNLRMPAYRSPLYKSGDRTGYNQPVPLRRFHFEWYRRKGKIVPIFGLEPACRFTLVNGTLQIIRQDIPGGQIACFNKLCKLFGPISREPTFRYLIRILVLLGCSQSDFYQIMRIRDLWVRNSVSTYYTSVNSMVFSFPKVIREYISSFPKKGERRRRFDTTREY